LSSADVRASYFWATSSAVCLRWKSGRGGAVRLGDGASSRSGSGSGVASMAATNFFAFTATWTAMANGFCRCSRDLFSEDLPVMDRKDAKEIVLRILSK
jgi:hypothetical protein